MKSFRPKDWNGIANPILRGARRSITLDARGNPSAALIRAAIEKDADVGRAKTLDTLDRNPNLRAKAARR